MNKFKFKAAVANHGEAMEAETISKNGRSSKSQKSRVFFLKKVCFGLLAVCIISGCASRNVSNFTAARGTVFSENGHSYEVINRSMNWEDARRYAEERGGYLATITSPGEQAFIKKLLERDGYRIIYFLGGFRDNHGEFQWLTGEPFVYTNWGPGEPNNDAGNDLGYEDKLMIYGHGRPTRAIPRARLGDWNDIHGISKITDEWWSQIGFIIEWDR